MKAWVQTAVGEYGERDVPAPRAGPGEVVLRVRAALTCGTDVKLLSRGHARVRPPLTMGHEASGEIVECAPEVRAFEVGERVVAGVSGPCGACAACRAGRENLCSDPQRVWGTFAELVRVPARVVATSLHRVPDGLSNEAAAFLDPLASVLHGWDRLGEFVGPLFIYGAGALALLWASVARSRGVDCIVAGRRARPLRLARELGARVLDLTVEEPAQLFAREGAWPDAAVDATGDPEVWARLPELVRPGGRVLLFGGCAPGTRVAFDATQLHYSEISLIGSFHYTPRDAVRALDVLAAREVDPLPLLSGRGPLAELPRFLDAHARGEGIRYALIP